jgi:NTE family protein
MPTKSNTPKAISLALQGGGSHGAFTWGVIDQLLADERVEIEAISATSGGAILAAILAQGLYHGSRDAARELLKNFWRKVSIASTLMPLRLNAMDKFLGNVGIDLSPSTLALDALTRMFSPYQFNLFDINPLRGIIGEMVDFKLLNKKSPLPIYVSATNTKTGKGRIFDAKEISLDAVMASACLPFVFKTVEIDGEPYWDGSFSGCPPLSPLTGRKETSDIVLVQVHPSQVDEVPTMAADILDRATELSFHSMLLQELKAIQLRNQLIADGAIKESPVHVHCIEAQDMLTGLGRASKLNTDWDFLIYVHDIGVQAATDWLEKNYDKIGKDSSADFSALAA